MTAVTGNKKVLSRPNRLHRQKDLLVKVDSMIGPGEKLTLIIKSSGDPDVLVLKSTTTYDVIPSSKTVIVAQTSPPIPKFMIGRTIEVTFIARTREFEYKRFGFRTLISNILPNYQLYGGRKAEAIELRYLAQGYERDLRQYFRVQPISEHPIDLAIPQSDEQLTAINISGAGLLFSRKISPESRRIEAGDYLTLLISLNAEEKLHSRTKVVRKFYKDHFEYVATKFSDMERHDKQILLNVLVRIQRIDLRKRSGLYYL